MPTLSEVFDKRKTLLNYDFTNDYLRMKSMRDCSLTVFFPKSFLRCSQQKHFSTIENPNRLRSPKNRRNTFITKA